MKKVNKTFLEEQVRQVLSEQTKICLKEQIQEPSLLARMDPVQSAAYEEGKFTKEHAKIAAKFVRDVAIGSKESWADVKKQYDAFGDFGVGVQSHYIEAMNSVAQLKSESLVNWANLMIRFYRTMPIEPTKGFNPKTLNLVAREDIANELWKIKSWGYSKILPFLRRSTNTKKYIKEIEQILKTMSHANNLSFQISGGLDESVEDVANSFGFTKSLSFSLWGKGKVNNKNTVPLYERPNDDQITKAAIQIQRGGRRRIETNLEKFIMGHFFGFSINLRSANSATFKRAMIRMTTKVTPVLSKIAKAHTKFQVASGRAVNAMLGMADIVTSVPTTVVLAVSLVAAIPTGGTSVAAAAGAAAGRKALISGLKTIVKGGTNKVVKSANALRGAKTYKKYVIGMESWKAQTGPLLIMLGKWSWDTWKEMWFGLDSDNKIFIKEYKNKTAKERAAFFDSEVWPNVKAFSKQHSDILDAARFDENGKKDIMNAFYSVGIYNMAAPNSIRQAYIRFDTKTILKYQSELEKLGEYLNAARIQMSYANRQGQRVAKTLGKLKQDVNDHPKALALSKKMPVLPPAKNFDKGMPAVKGLAAATSRSGVKINRKKKNKIMESISLGSNEQTSDEILQDLKKKFSPSGSQSKEENKLTINLGYKDALEYSKGNPIFSIEKTKKNVQDIIATALEQGAELSITPVPKSPSPKDVSSSVDIVKFQNFAREVNSSILELPILAKNKNVSKPAEGISNSDTIIVGDSNAAGLVFHGKYRGKLNHKRDYVTTREWSSGGRIYVDPKTREPLEPAIGAYTTGRILQKLKKFYDFKGNQYRPSIAIVHMGYNDHSQAPTSGFDNIQKTVNFLRSKGVSDVRVILTKGKGNPYGVNPNFEQDMKQLSDRLRNELTGAKIIPNNGKISSDGIHFFGSYKKIYNDALSGATVTKAPTTSNVSSPSASELPPGLPSAAIRYYPLFKKYSEMYNMNVALMMGVCHRESNFRANRVSHTKDYGLMQINRGNWQMYGLTKDNVFDPETNIKTGILFFSKIRNTELPKLFKQRKSIIKWEELTEEEKDRMALYAYNWGPWGLFKYRKPHKYKDINKFFANMAKYYKNYNYVDKKTGERKYIPLEDYSLKAINFAKKYGYTGSTTTGGGTGATGIPEPAASAVQKPVQNKATDTSGIQTQIATLEEANNFEDFQDAVAVLLGINPGRARYMIADIKRANSYLKTQNITNFVNQRISYLKSIHRNNYSKWKREYQKDIKLANGAEDEIEAANKKMAWYHRPVLYVTARPVKLSKFFAFSTKISFGFEPRTNRISSSYQGRETFYANDSKNNSTYKKFIKELELLKKATQAAAEKISELIQNADYVEKEKLTQLESYLVPMANIVDKVYKGLTAGGTEISRKAYLLYVLDLAMKTT